VVTQVHSAFDAGAVSLTGLQQWLDALPAEDRARIAWAPTEFQQALDTFLGSSMSSSDIDALARAYLTLFLPMVQASLDAAFANFASRQPQLEATARADVELLKERATRGGADVAEYVIRASVALFAALSTLYGAPSVETLDKVRVAAVTQPPGPLVVMRALTLAAIEAARRGDSAHKISSIIFHAFDVQRVVIGQLAAAGTVVQPFKGESRAQRLERLERYAQHVRAITTDDDWAAMAL
jgi:hypothetical protein